MQQQVTQQAAKTDEPVEVRPADLSNPELDESTACCLADIDAALAEVGVESETDRALREFDALTDGSPYISAVYGAKAADVAVWLAQYKHLGITRSGRGCCSGEPYTEVIGPDGESHGIVYG